MPSSEFTPFFSSSDFRPTCITRFIDNFDSGAGTLFVDTDAGKAYVKALGNPGGPHVLACEWVGTRLASVIGLPTFDHALVQVDEMDVLPFFGNKSAAEPGPAFATRAENGTTWGRDKRLLNRIENPTDISRMVVFDTWVLNYDRYGPGGSRIKMDNVFFSTEAEGGMVELRVMDHTHCFTNGAELTRRVQQIGMIKDERIFGLFPEFREMLDQDAVRTMCQQMASLRHDVIEDIVQRIPNAWSVSAEAKEALIHFIVQRAAYLADTIEDRLFGGTQLELPNMDSE